MTAPACLPVLLTGSGSPVTVVAHGLGGSLPETRLFVGGVPGTRVLYAARGHGPLPVVPGWQELARDLRAVLDVHAATRALGVSMGASTLLRLLAQTPDRLERVVLLLPSALDAARTDDAVHRLALLAVHLRAKDRAGVVGVVRAELPADLLEVPAVEAYTQSRAEFLLSCAGLPELLDALPSQAPVVDRSRLATVTAQVLVVVQQDDPLHPAQVGRELVAVLPRARLVVFERPGMAFRERARLRAEFSSFLQPQD